LTQSLISPLEPSSEKQVSKVCFFKFNLHRYTAYNLLQFLSANVFNGHLTGGGGGGGVVGLCTLNQVDP
jgi:hypothetical protein